MKQVHKQTGLSHRRDEEMASAQSQSPPYSPKAPKHPRSINYLLRERRLLFILVGILIGSSFFIIQPALTSPEPRPLLSGSATFPSHDVVSGRVPVGINGRRLRIVVTGGAGFVGSHLVDKLIARGNDVIVIDNFFTGRKENLVHLFGNPRFELIRHDVVDPILLEVDQIYHLACPASPVHYKYNPVKTIKTNVMGTLNLLGLAKRIGARFLLTSTSEVYGDPLEHPQKETYWGNVNPIGERSCYDEGKRTAETLTMDYHRGAGVEVRIARIFNTYGPRMCLDDGRVVSNFVAQAIRKQPLTVYGDGKQTRSFQYVSDLVNGLVALMDGEHVGPFNLGNPGEFTMLELAQVVKETIDSSATIEYKPNTADDPHMRKPDISKAKELLNWEPKVSLREGLPLMISDFRNRILNDSMDQASSSSSSSSPSSNTIQFGGRAIDRHNPIITDSRRTPSRDLNAPSSSSKPPIVPKPFHKAKKNSTPKPSEQKKKNASKGQDQKKKKKSAAEKLTKLITNNYSSKPVDSIPQRSWVRPHSDIITPHGSSRYLLSDTASSVGALDYDPVLALTKVDNEKAQVVHQDEINHSSKPSSCSPPKSGSSNQVVVLRVSLHCKGCEGKVRKHLSRMKGVTSFDIDFKAKKVTVVGDVIPLSVLASISKVKNAQFWPASASAVESDSAETRKTNLI
ncbi:UDP-glucuronic acid decarboxylase 1-like [Gastrolobium bilobum]|uniref:UDP-glucuronic acid decarboxylase 1-like n=1 Tax=Gastrolobium bilobum TaxID=150636 RepID=UPI002AAFF4CA|nr:UDP-glucuronic acid decarboxylase 1-like [Gastrolobium bilobum]